MAGAPDVIWLQLNGAADRPLSPPVLRIVRSRISTTAYSHSTSTVRILADRSTWR